MSYRGAQRRNAMKKVSEAIKDYIHSNRMTQSDLSRRTGIPRDHISRYVRMASLPHPENARALQNETGIDFPSMMATEEVGGSDASSGDMSIDQRSDGTYRVRMDRVMSFEQLTELFNLLKEHE
ncbi:hypothetical protein BH688_05665 [Kushneria phosphatilytica]|nr:hypothetical protein BH688_05665 [Kushneria phosphatilytica]